MKVFSRRPGVELLEVSGEYLLVATKEARDACPYVTQINAAAADYWKLMDKPYAAAEFVDLAARSFDMEKKSVLFRVMAFLSKMKQSGYLVEEDVE